MKILTNFYIEESDKQECINKLNRLKGVENKGQFASLLRVLIKQFIATPDDKVNPMLLEAIEAEYTYSQTLNKRSRM